MIINDIFEQQLVKNIDIVLNAVNLSLSLLIINPRQKLNPYKF